MPTSAKENEDGGVERELTGPSGTVLSRLASKASGVSLADGAFLLVKWEISLTISCSPSNFIPIADSFAVSA